MEVIHVEFMPKDKKQNTLYISKEFNLAIHLCACGCGVETVTPIGKNGWELKEQNNKVTLHSSIGNYRFPCKSHYWIRDNEVVWC